MPQRIEYGITSYGDSTPRERFEHRHDIAGAGPLPMMNATDLRMWRPASYVHANARNEPLHRTLRHFLEQAVDVDDALAGDLRGHDAVRLELPLDGDWRGLRLSASETPCRPGTTPVEVRRGDRDALRELLGKMADDGDSVWPPEAVTALVTVWTYLEATGYFADAGEAA